MTIAQKIENSYTFEEVAYALTDLFGYELLDQTFDSTISDLVNSLNIVNQHKLLAYLSY